MRKRNARLSAFVEDADKKKFVALTSSLEITVSDAIARLVAQAIKKGKIPK